MHCKAFIFCAAVCALFTISLLSAQTGPNGAATEQMIQALASQVASADIYFKEAYQLINLDLPQYPTYNPQLIQEAERRNTRFRYLMGVIRARSKFIYDTKLLVINLKSDFQRSNPLPYVNYDTHSTRTDQDRYRIEQIKAKVRAYDSAITCLDNMYKNYQNRIGNLVESASRLRNYVIYYKVNIQNKNESYMVNQFEGALIQEENRGMRDAGGMSNTEYQARSLALNVLIPMFDSAASKKPAESLSEALSLIFKLLPKP